MYIIVVGCGRLGSNLANELSDFGHAVCIIDRDKEKLAVLGSGFNGQRINGIEFDSDNLVQGGIEQADALIAVTSDDNINITVSLIANEIYHVPQVIARINDPNRKYVYEKLNIETINPVRLGAELLLNRLTVKSCDVISQLNNEYQIIDFMINKKNSTSVVGEIEKKYSCIISGVNRGGNVSLPKQDDQIHCGDRILRDKDTCMKIADELDADVICGDGTDLEVLKDAGIDGADSVIKASSLIIICYMVLFGIGALLGVFYGYPLASAAFESASVAGNVGLTIGITAPAMPVVLKIYYILAMYMGRLEFISVFALVGYVFGGIKKICARH